MQNFIPDEYLGKRVKLTAFIKSEDVKSWAGMWFRVDRAKGNVSSLDNMQAKEDLWALEEKAEGLLNEIFKKHGAEKQSNYISI